MSTIQNEIDRIKESVADAYETVELMGGDVPSPDLQKIDTLSDSIATIKGGSGGGGSENILLNWDFRNPVNRSGSTMYSLTSTRCTVDSWYSENGCVVNVVDGGVTFDPKNDTTCVFGQNVKEWGLMKGKIVTFSVLVSNVTAAGLNLWIYGVEGPVAFPAIEVGNDVALYSITGTVDNSASSLRCGIQAVSSTATIKMIAAKLEYGSKQTLVKQNSDNVWEILDPPNYDLQYILCSQYDPITDVRIGSKHSNVNFIQNWYFPQPVNRIGKTSGFTKDETVIDRWSNFGMSNKVSVTSSGIELSSWMEGSTKYRGFISHVLSEGVFEFLVNKQVTLSFLTASGELGVLTEVVSPTDTMEYVCSYISKIQGFIYRWSGYMSGRFCVIIGADNGQLTSGDYTEDNPLTDTIVAIKLELGPIQTLARKEGDIWVLNDVPDYDLQYLLCSQYDPTKPIPTRNVYYHSNPNLLLNWDFRNPVNRNGKTEYIGTKYGIDKWSNGSGAKVTLTDEGIILSHVSSSWGDFIQFFENQDFMMGKQYTFSLIMDNELYTKTFIMGNVASGNLVLVQNFNLLSVNGRPIILRTYNNYSSGVISAMKLELGSTQTLAKKNTSGEWEIIDPPNYDLQYLLTSQYSPINGEYVGIQHSNPNLLDNWYFPDPINQRGQTEYGANTYTIDRWYVGNNRKLTIENGYVRLERTEVNYNSAFEQRVDVSNFNGLLLTFSAIYRTTDTRIRFCINCDATWEEYSNISPSDDWNMISRTFTIPAGAKNAFVRPAQMLTDSSGGGYIDILAAKLELGPVQTLAHKEGDTLVLNDPPPDKTLELPKCQRHQIVLTSDQVRAFYVTKDSIYFDIPLPVKMRVKPTISVNGFNVMMLNMTNVPDFTFSVHSLNNQNVLIRADKANHGLTDSVLNAGFTILDANL